MPAVGSSGLLATSTNSTLAFRVVVDDQLERMQDGHGAAGAAVEVVALEVLEHFDIRAAVGARDAAGGDEGADGLGRKAAAANAAERGHARIVPAADALFLHELEELALAEHGVGDVEAVELDLLRRGRCRAARYTSGRGAGGRRTPGYTWSG